MNFREIWEESKDKIIIPAINGKTPVTPPKGDGSEDIPPEASKLRILKVLSLLGVDSFDELAETERKMLEYIAEKVPGNLGDQIVNIESRIGTPPIGMSRIRNIYNHLKFGNEIKSGHNRRQQQDPLRDSGADAHRSVEVTIKL